MSELYQLDYKAYMPLAEKSLFKKREHYKNALKWDSIKNSIRNADELNWNEILKQFFIGKLLCHEKNKPNTKDEHHALKSLFVFFQHGYVLKQYDNVGVYRRENDKNPRLTDGYSILISSSENAIGNHEIGKEKILRTLGYQVNFKSITPFAIGYTDLHLNENKIFPSYFWILHEVTIDAELPKIKREEFNKKKDSFIGCKKISNLYNGKVTHNKSKVNFNGEMDRLLVELLQTNSIIVSKENTCIRQLPTNHFSNIQNSPFKEKNTEIKISHDLLKQIRNFLIPITIGLDVISRTELAERIIEELSKIL